MNANQDIRENRSGHTAASLAGEKEGLASLFTRHAEALQALRRQVPDLFDLLEGRYGLADAREAWATFLAAPIPLRAGDRVPALVAVLAGPSGAGKSTLFTLLTGIAVPAGNDVRPMSRSSALAVPDTLLEGQGLADLFPGHRFERLDRPDRLRARDIPGDTIFYEAFALPQPDTGLALVLADIPDFNTVERSNWAKAERMIHRADVVLFTVYPEGYKDERTVAILHRCCRSAGYLACLFTKTPPEAARRIWEDLKEYVATADAFADTRHDGCTLAAFVAQAPAYASPHRETPALEDLEPLDGKTARLPSLLWGLKGAAVLLERQSQAVREGTRTARTLCEYAFRRAETLERQLAEIDRSIHDEAAGIAGAQFPIGRLLELVIETAREARPRWLRVASGPVSLLAHGVLWVGGRLRGLFDLLHSREVQREIRRRDPAELEKERLEQGVERLLDHWRGMFPGESDTRLSPDAYRGPRDAFLALPVPGESTRWEDYVKDRIRTWMNETRFRKQRVLLLAVANDLLLALGGAAAVIDYAILGGFGTTGIVAAAGGTSVLAGVLLKLFEEMGLRAQLVDADKHWRELRGASLERHLREAFAGPLIRTAWADECGRLVDRANGCREACDKLDRLREEVAHV